MDGKEVDSSMSESLALKRIRSLLDDDSFVEVNALVSARTTNFAVKPKPESPDGVITGYGQIEGNPVFVYSQDRASLGGTMGEMHAKKICNLYDLASRTAAPVIGFLDSAGFRLDESVDALDAFGRLLDKMLWAQENLIQISAVMGQCAGGMTMIPAISDFTFMTKDAKMFVNAPHTLADDPALARNFNSADYQNSVSGQAQVLESEDAVIEKIRTIVPFLTEKNYGVCSEEDLNRMLSTAAIESGDIRTILSECADTALMEIRPDYAPEMVTGFLKLNGITVGVIGNSAALYDENGEKTVDLPSGLTACGCRKAAEHVRFCRSFDIPLLTVSAAEGFACSKETETALAPALADLAGELHGADSAARVSLIIGDTYGTAYTILNAKAIGGADISFAWAGVKTGMMQAEKAAAILFAGADAAETAKQAAALDEFQNAVESAAARGSVDVVIDPAETRKHLIMAFSML